MRYEWKLEEYCLEVDEVYRVSSKTTSKKTVEAGYRTHENIEWKTTVIWLRVALSRQRGFEDCTIYNQFITFLYFKRWMAHQKGSYNQQSRKATCKLGFRSLSEVYTDTIFTISVRFIAVQKKRWLLPQTFPISSERSSRGKTKSKGRSGCNCVQVSPRRR